MCNEIRRANAAVGRQVRRQHQPGAAVLVLAIPRAERILTGPRGGTSARTRRIRADVGDLDAHRATVGFGRMPGALLQIKCLVDRPVHVEHKVDG